MLGRSLYLSEIDHISITYNALAYIADNQHWFILFDTDNKRYITYPSHTKAHQAYAQNGR